MAQNEWFKRCCLNGLRCYTPPWRIAKGGGGVLILFHKLILEKFTCNIYKRENFKSPFLCSRFQGNLEVFTKWKKNLWIIYILGSKSSLTRIQNFSSHAHLSVKFSITHNFCLITHHIQTLYHPLPSQRRAKLISTLHATQTITTLSHIHYFITNNWTEQGWVCSDLKKNPNFSMVICTDLVLCVKYFLTPLFWLFSLFPLKVLIQAVEPTQIIAYVFTDNKYREIISHLVH